MTLPLARRAPLLSTTYTDAPLDALLAQPDVLAVIAFGAQAPHSDDPRLIRVALEPLGHAPLEVWRGGAPVRHGRVDDLAFAHDDHLLVAAMDVPEIDGDIRTAAAHAYASLRTQTAALGYPHLLRIWNYVDDITLGEGDEERYKQFCVGRAAGLGEGFVTETLPAATAIGRIRPNGRLQVYWLASRTPGTPLENPRQVSAYRYPRQYGPQPPSFARAMLPPAPMPLLLSGTASIRGHESLHHDSVEAQLDETLANIDALIDVARTTRPELPAAPAASTPLKAYVREADELARVDAAMASRLPGVPRVVLHARVCRRELRLEIDGCHGEVTTWD
ncbi:pteridine-dependent deoxygenase [Cognatilysobacter segetis]|uniref:chorismate transformation enzyme, FkbO/Hyg5 family n=1 Tax=Cognatilysobacter segetis TaxID=2492394 RepID=UPI00105EC780|nr:pteridine-dependent deoxygenase [Lysobacter segetis]